MMLTIRTFLRRFFCASAILSVWLVTAVGGGGCATPAATDLRPMNEREIRAYTRRGRDPRAFYFSIREDSQGQLIFVDAHRQVTDHTAVLPFESPRRSRFPLIAVQASPARRPYLAVLDSTASESWTSMDRMDALNLTIILIDDGTLGTEPDHVIDTLPGLLSAAPHLYLDSLKVEAPLFFARTAEGPLWPLSRSSDAAHADAVLGLPFLRSFAYVQWDFPGRSMVFSAGQPYEPDPDALLAELPISSDSAGLMVTASVDGRMTRVLLDTAGDFAFAMDDPPGAVLPQLRLGDLVSRRIRTVSTRTLPVSRPEVPRIGIQWLSAYRVTLDNHRRVVYLESP